MNREYLARFLVILVVVGLVIAAIAFRLVDDRVYVHAVMPENGGWLPDTITIEVGHPLKLRLVSDDVVHGFAIGQNDAPAVDLHPGVPTEITLEFDQPGTYTYYCTRWCGPNHWRMRGTIVVRGDEGNRSLESVSPPLYLTLGLELDAHREVPVDLLERPSAARGQELGITIPADRLDPEYVLQTTPYEVWQDMQVLYRNLDLSNDDLWNLVVYTWTANSTQDSIQNGANLFAQNCAACHGTDGEGDGVFAIEDKPGVSHDPVSSDFGHEPVTPTDFTDPSLMLETSSAILQGKIVRGGMGTGMPSWGLIFTEKQTWDLTQYLWTFIFNFEE